MKAPRFGFWGAEGEKQRTGRAPRGTAERGQNNEGANRGVGHQDVEKMSCFMQLEQQNSMKAVFLVFWAGVSGVWSLKAHRIQFSCKQHYPKTLWFLAGNRRLLKRSIT